MSKVRTVVKNTFVLLLASIFTNIAGFIWTVAMARYLGAGGFGIISASLAITSIFGIFADLGLSIYLTREIARKREKSLNLFRNVISLKTIFSIITFTFLLVIIFIRKYPVYGKIVTILIGIYVILQSFNNVFYGVFQGFEKMEYQTISTILNNSLLLIFILGVIYLKLGIIEIGMAYTLSAFISLLYSYLICNSKFLKVGIAVNSDLWKKILPEALPFGITGIFTNIYFWIDSAMLSFMKNDVVVGLYNAPYKIMQALLFIYSTYMIALFPVMSKFYIQSSERLTLTYQKSLKYMLLISMPIAVFTTILAKEITLLVYGPQYLPAVPAFQILIWTIVFIFTNGIFANLLNSSNRQVTVTKTTGIAAAFNVVVNLILIPKMSYIGASITTVATELLITIMFIYCVNKTKYKLKFSMINTVLKILCLNIVLAIILMTPIYLILKIILGVVAYFIGIIAVRVLDEIDWLIIKMALGIKSDQK
ncbi:polysaccharide biosynthesis protein [Methanothermus fervidus DSM 2088]|uniref:Polysaccharide biosynthesis protein n=1 Tax=Methanothermus fervidus (strain ATCC 43054 / DSM 2088 / JCM 10308 / V24 S) TaxID=523846 RepID=E3GZ73_METFV|nr:flippase [Methanothermus fervidus]ADP77605.1 polysaccharide biosynthesis protein [Methanothermus fervidus DSM 2088]